MFCSKCGKPIPDTARFCPFCGSACSSGAMQSEMAEKKVNRLLREAMARTDALLAAIKMT